MPQATRELEDYDTVPWADFWPGFKWQQGEHVVTVAPTGGGKSTLLARLLPKRESVVVFVTKLYDPVFQQEYLRQGYKRIEQWSDARPWDRKLLLWPGRESTLRGTLVKQRVVFKEALDRIFHERGWCIVIDEQHYMCASLGLQTEIAMYLHQGRSAGLTVVNGIQRPAWVPVVTYSGSQHGFIWKTTDAKDASRLANLGGTNAKELGYNALKLKKHEFIYVNTTNGRAPIRTQVDMNFGKENQ
jgi:hypothetical protein